MLFVLGMGKMRDAGRAVKSARFATWTLSLCLALAMVFVIAPGLTVRSQSGPPRGIINRPAPMPTDPRSSGDYDPTMIERRIRGLNNERQKEMVSDTNKLLKLARELNYEVDGGGADTLTPDQLRTLATIEKLARSVKEKMSEGTGQPGPASVGPTMNYPHP